MRPLSFRPQIANDFIGATRVNAALVMSTVARVMKEPSRFAHLYYGSPGSGKTALAMMAAMQLSGSPLAIEQLNGQSLSPDRIREWRQRAPYKELFGNWTCKVVDELDAFSSGAESELITFLDGLPTQWGFVATTNRNLQTRKQSEEGIVKDEMGPMVPFRIHSRMQVYKFKPVSTEEIATWLHALWIKDMEAARDIAAANEGNVRGALNDADRHLDMMALAAA